MRKQSDPEVEIKFNLLDEPWILAMGEDLKVKEVSLLEVLTHSHKYLQLAGEMETQNAALLRVLIAIVFTVLYRYDSEGNPESLSDTEDDEQEEAVERWAAVWNSGKLPESVIRDYLEQYRDCFWLVHPERPFWQVNSLKGGTEYEVKTLLGDVKESNNPATTHHFTMRSGEALEKLSYAEAARWLIHLNAYAVNIKFAKESGGEKVPIGIGRLGQTGLIMFKGKNLFETIMLNCPMLRNGTELWREPKPEWERKKKSTVQNEKLSAPADLASLLTIQSRRILLQVQDDKVVGYRAIGGEYLENKDLFAEQMTIWRKREDKKTGESWYEPQTHQPEVQAWREFPVYFGTEKHHPGLFDWISLLQEMEIIDKEEIYILQTTGMTYGSMSYTYDEAFSDSLALSAQLFSNIGRVWQGLVINEIEKCSRIADELMKNLARNLSGLIYGGGQNAKNKSESIWQKLKEQYYEKIDHDFRSWILGIDFEKDHEEQIREWQRISARAARQVAEDQLSELQNLMFTVREDSDGGRRSIPQIYNWFLGGLRNIYGNLWQSEQITINETEGGGDEQRR